MAPSRPGCPSPRVAYVRRSYGEILLAGTTHYPLLLYTDDAMTSQMERHWKSDRVPDWWKDQKNWPREMQKEYGRNGLASAAAHRQRLVEGFRRVRGEIEAFNLDFVLIWGDDQCENFHEDLVPPFSIYICDKFETQPFRKRRFTTDGTEVFNVWGEDSDHVFTHQGHPEGAKYLTTRLLEMGYPMPYAYKTLHFQSLPHAFLNTLAFLDYDRKGFPYPVIPFHVNRASGKPGAVQIVGYAQLDTPLVFGALFVLTLVGLAYYLSAHLLETLVLRWFNLAHPAD